eukprot:scaffold130090_cov34-Prasinocladus_malaysianus.AAC.2
MARKQAREKLLNRSKEKGRRLLNYERLDVCVFIVRMSRIRTDCVLGLGTVECEPPHTVIWSEREIIRTSTVEEIYEI